MTPPDAIVERVWLKDYLNREAVEAHRHLECGAAH
jgi:hypothetical protein